MRILVVNQYFHPDVASTAQLLTELCEDLARHHEVAVVCGRPSYDPVERGGARGLVHEEDHRGVRVLRTWSTAFPRKRLAGRLTNYSTYLMSSLLGAMRAARPDVILTMTDPPIVAAAAAAAARTRRVPFVYVVQDLFPQVGVVLGRIRNPALVSSLERLNRSLRGQAAAVVAIGRDMADRLHQLGVPDSKLRVIPNWADGSAIRPLEGLSALRVELGLADAFVVMHSGNVGFSQGLDTLLAAARILRDERGVRFLVVGNGAAKASLVRKAELWGLSNVTFLGYQPKDTLSDSLGAADVHVIGLERGLAGLIVPSKMYAIMAAGRPFVAAVEREGEVARVAAESACGVVIEPGKPEVLAAGLVALRKNSSLREMGQRGRREFERAYDRPRAAVAYRLLLEAVGRAHT